MNLTNKMEVTVEEHEKKSIHKNIKNVNKKLASNVYSIFRGATTEIYAFRWTEAVYFLYNWFAQLEL